MHPVGFAPYVELLRLILARRDEIVERIEPLLNAQRKPVQYLQDARLLSRHFEDCFFTRDQSHLRGQLDEAHWTSGFKPRKTPGLHNDLVDPGEMMVRAFHLWQQTHWPGHSGRVRYAHTLFNLYVIRCLALLTLRLLDGLSDVQSLLDDLWKTSPADQPVLVRDARWLIPVAQSPTTDELHGYFEVARQVVDIEIHNAAVRMAGGHLRSQLRHLCIQKNVSLDDNSLVLTTRTSNALDLALLIQGLVPLLDSYERAIQSVNTEKRLEFADAICQGISPDPELFVNRLDLLGPYSMIEHLFITTDAEGQVIYTPMGRRHVEMVQQYEALITRLSEPLSDDCKNFRPVTGTYSPYGVLFGFSSNLLEHMAFKTLQRDAATCFSLEDVFTSGGADKLAWVSGWRKLPHIKPEVAKLFEYPQQFAEDIFARIERALHRRDVIPTGRLFIEAGEGLQTDSIAQFIRHEDKQFLHSRVEGEFLVSYKSSEGWIAVSKDILTEALGRGHDVKIVGLPRDAAEVLNLMCPKLVS